MLPYSAHFELEELANGIYAAIASDSAAASNAGIVDLGGATLIFDTFLTPEAANDLLLAARELTGRAPAFVVNSHYHADHVRGNPVFPDSAVLISTRRTRELLASRGVEQLETLKENGPETLSHKQTALAAATDEAMRARLRAEIEESSLLLASLPDLVIRLPDLTFERRLTLYGERRSAELVTYGGGHTESDAVLCLPDAGIVFLADLMFVGYHAYLSDGEPEENVRILDLVAELPASTFVCGHGPVGTVEDVRFMQRYIRLLTERVVAAARGGLSHDKVTELPVPAELTHLENLANMYQGNLDFLYRRYVGGPGTHSGSSPD